MNIMQHQEMKNKEASQTPEVNVLRAKLQENSKVKENISQQRNAQVREDTARPGDCIQRTGEFCNDSFGQNIVVKFIINILP